MKQTTNLFLSPVFLIFAVALIASKLMWIGLSWNWPKYQDSKVKQDATWPIESYKFASLLVLSSPQQVFRTTTFDGYILKAIYKSATNSFILFKDGDKSVILGRGESYNGFTLDAIYPEKAIFVNGNAKKELYFKKAVPANQPAASQSGNGLKLSKSEFAKYQKNPALLASDIPAQMKNGKVYIKSVKADTFFAKAGIISGDSIVSFNNVQINSIMDLVSRLSASGESRSVSVGIIRDNVKKEINYELQ